MMDLRDLILLVFGLVILALGWTLTLQGRHVEDLNRSLNQQKKVIEVFADLGDACIAHKDQIERLEGTINELLTGDY